MMTTDTQSRTGFAATAVPVFSILLSSLGTSIANVALPQMAAGFSAPFATVQWVVIGYLLSLTVLSAGAGRLGDRIGHGRALRYGTALFTVAAMAAALAPQVGWLIAARMVQGAGAAAMTVLPMALLRETAGPERLGRAMGLLGTASAIGIGLGPAVGGFLIAAFGWRAVFWVLTGMGLVALGVAPRPVAVARPKAGAVLDPRGAGLFALAISAFALAATLHSGWISVGLLVLSVVALLVFRRVERDAVHPFFPRGAFADALLRRGLMANALVSAVMIMTLVVGPFYLSHGVGLDAAMVGLAMTLGPVMSSLSGIPAGRLVDRFGAAGAAQLGVALMAVAVTAIAVMAPMLGLWGYLGGVVFLSPGYQLFLAANTTQVLLTAGEGQRGATSGLLGLSRNLGLISGAAGMGALFAWAVGQSDVTTAASAQIIRGTSASFAAAAGLLIVAVVLMRPGARK
jgi:MFS family permease